MNNYREALKNCKIFSCIWKIFQCGENKLQDFFLSLKDFPNAGEIIYFKMEDWYLCLKGEAAIKVISVYLAKIFLFLFMLVLLSANFGDKQKVTI